MAIEDKLEIVTKVANAYGGEVSPNDIMQISELAEMGDYEKVAGIIVYIRRRLIDRASRVDAFRAAFPQRCLKTSSDGAFDSDKPIGAPLGESTIKIKAKRLEGTKAYKAALSLLQTSMYVAYAVERMSVLEKAYELAMDDSVTTRDRHNYMKLFLEETRKPEETKAMELNVSLTQNNISIQQVEEKLDGLAKQLSKMGASADEIIDTVIKVPRGSESE